MPLKLGYVIGLLCTPTETRLDEPRRMQANITARMIRAPKVPPIEPPIMPPILPAVLPGFAEGARVGEGVLTTKVVTVTDVAATVKSEVELESYPC